MDAKEIRELRTRMELTQNEFGSALGVRGEAVNRWENSVGRPGLRARRQLNRLAREAEAKKC